MAQHAFHRQGIYDPEQEAYVATSVLQRFSRTDKLENPFAGLKEDKSSWYVTDALAKARRAGEYQATVTYRHIGDRTLFMLGLFPESLDRFGLQPLYETTGPMSYRTVARLYPKGGVSDLFLSLGHNFRKVMTGLRAVRDQIGIGKPDEWKYVLLTEERKFLEDWMLDTINRWKTSRMEGDKKLALQLAAELGSDIEGIFL